MTTVAIGIEVSIPLYRDMANIADIDKKDIKVLLQYIRFFILPPYILYYHGLSIINIDY